MTRTIPHRELRNSSSAVLRDVQAGATVQITNHGEVVAVLSPPPAAAGDAARRRAATIRGGFTALSSITIDHPVQVTLDELRGER